MANVPIGGIIAFSGTFGGVDNRYPIPLGSTTADTNWCLCDGIETNSKTVPDLRGRMIIGADDVYAAGTSGGSTQHSHSITGSVSSTTLTTAQMPSHYHTANGAVSSSGGVGGGHSGWWQGGVNTSSVGGSTAHTHNLSSATAETASSLPPYYSLAFIMRIN